MAEHRVRSMSSHLLTATNATSCRTTFNRKYLDAPLVRVVAQSGRRYDLAHVTSPLADLPLFGAAALISPTPSREAGAPVRSTAPGPVLKLESLPLTQTARRTLEGSAPRLRADGQIDRSASLLAMARVLAGMHWSAERIARTLAERDQTLGWASTPSARTAPPVRLYRRLRHPTGKVRIGFSDALIVDFCTHSWYTIG